MIGSRSQIIIHTIRSFAKNAKLEASVDFSFPPFLGTITFGQIDNCCHFSQNQFQ